MQIKTIVRLFLTYEIAKIQKFDNVLRRLDCGKTAISPHCQGQRKSAQPVRLGL